MPSLREIQRLIPAHCFRSDDLRAARFLALTVTVLAASEALAALSWARGWWWLYPLAWGAAGTMLTSLFLITHDCGHDAFFRDKRINEVVGHLVSIPLLYPFHQWSAWHDAHHRRTNHLGQTFVDQMEGHMVLGLDTAFVPEQASAPPRRPRGIGWWVYVLSRRAPPLAVMLIPVLLSLRFPIRQQRRPLRYVVSLAAVVTGGAAIGGGIYLATGSALAIVHFWLAPLAVHACWLGYYAFLQHTGPELPFDDDASYRRGEAQLTGTVNTAVPWLIRVLHSNPDCHVVHHISTAIPSYHMRDANDAILASPHRDVIREVPFSLARFVRLTRQCHVWSEAQRAYVTFAQWSSGGPRGGAPPSA